MIKISLSKAEKSALDEELFEYRIIINQIAVRKLEIETEREADENIGGGSSGIISKPQETLVIKFDSDRRIQYLQNLKRDVDYCYDNLLTEEQKRIFDLRWKDDEANTWEDIAEKIYCSEKSVYRKRDKILEKYAKAKGKLPY